MTLRTPREYGAGICTVFSGGFLGSCRTQGDKAKALFMAELLFRPMNAWSWGGVGVGDEK